MNISSLSSGPITLDRRTPDILKKAHRVGNNESYREYRPFGRDDRSFNRSSFISEAPSGLGRDAPYFTSPQYNNDYSSLRDKSFTKNPLPKQEEDYTPQYTKRYEPLRRVEKSRSPSVNSYPPGAFEVYQPRPLALQRTVNVSYYVNGIIVFCASLLFLYVNLGFINLWIDKEELSVYSLGFLKILMILSFILFSKALILKPYDQHVNWIDRARALFFQISLTNLALFFIFLGMVAFTYDIFVFLKNVVVESEIERIVVISVLNSMLSLARYLARKDYLLETLSFETNRSFLSLYHPKNLSLLAVDAVKFSFCVNLLSSVLCYSGFISLIFQDTLEMYRSLCEISSHLSSFQYGNMGYPGFLSALERFSRDFVIVWCANFIVETQTQILKKVWIRILNGIGSTRYSLQPLYYFNDFAEGDEVLLSHCLRFLDTKIRYECRNTLLLRQNPADSESKTVWHIFVDSTLQQLEKINLDLQGLKASRLVLTGSINARTSQDRFLLMLEQLFTSSHEVRGLKNLYYDINKATHQFRVISRVFREIKILNLDMIIRNFSVNLQTYYRGLTSVLLAIDHIKQINKSIYVNTFLQNIHPFEEAIKDSLLLLNRFVITQ